MYQHVAKELNLDIQSSVNYFNSSLKNTNIKMETQHRQTMSD